MAFAGRIFGKVERDIPGSQKMIYFGRGSVYETKLRLVSSGPLSQDSFRELDTLGVGRICKVLIIKGREFGRDGARLRLPMNCVFDRASTADGA